VDDSVEFELLQEAKQKTSALRMIVCFMINRIWQQFL
jgi:hypothetical protein